MPVSRQLRLNDPRLIRQRVREFLGKKINIVLTDGRVMVGDLVSVTDEGITLINMRMKKVHYPFAAIDEIYFDIVVNA